MGWFVLLCVTGAGFAVWSLNPKLPQIKFEKRIKQSKQYYRKYEFVGLRWPYVLGGVAALVLLSVIGWWGIGIAAAAGIIYIPYHREQAAKQKELQLISITISNWAEQVKSLVQSGTPLPDAMKEAAINIRTITPLGEFAAEMEAYDTKTALESLSMRLNSPTADEVIGVLLTAEVEGAGNVAGALESACDHIRANVTLEEEIEAARAGSKSERYITFFGGIAVGGGVIVFAGTAEFYQNFVGQLVLLLLLGMMVVIMGVLARMEKMTTPDAFVINHPGRKDR